MSEISLPALLKRSLDAASKAYDLPTISDESQQLVQSSLLDLRQVHTHIRDLALFSPNESLDDISTKDLLYLTLPYVLADMENRVRTTERADRMAILTKAVGHFQAFVHQLEHYGIIPEQDKILYSRKSSTLADPGKKREIKVNQYKKMKDIKGRIQVLEMKRKAHTSPSSDTTTDFGLITSLLLASPSNETEIELDSSVDDILRETTILLLRMFYAQTHAHLESMEQEQELLQNAPPSPSGGPPSEDEKEGRTKTKEDEKLWRLDVPAGGRGYSAEGPLLDHRGRPLRPFTILPSDTGERARMQAQVFGPGYKLPTMTIEEYLEIEKQQGNIITGGGPASLDKPTTSEQLAIDSEMDGTIDGEMKAEEKRQKDEQWAQYKDTHPRGAGNTMNRG